LVDMYVSDLSHRTQTQTEVRCGHWPLQCTTRLLCNRRCVAPPPPHIAPSALTHTHTHTCLCVVCSLTSNRTYFKRGFLLATPSHSLSPRGPLLVPEKRRSPLPPPTRNRRPGSPPYARHHQFFPQCSVSRKRTVTTGRPTRAVTTAPATAAPAVYTNAAVHGRSFSLYA
jgi:hypothetical protein